GPLEHEDPGALDAIAPGLERVLSAGEGLLLGQRDAEDAAQTGGIEGPPRGEQEAWTGRVSPSGQLHDAELPGPSLSEREARVSRFGFVEGLREHPKLSPGRRDCGYLREEEDGERPLEQAGDPLELAQGRCSIAVLPRHDRRLILADEVGELRGGNAGLLAGPRQDLAVHCRCAGAGHGGTEGKGSTVGATTGPLPSAHGACRAHRDGRGALPVLLALLGLLAATPPPWARRSWCPPRPPRCPG